MALIPNGSKMPSTNKQPEVKKPAPIAPVKIVTEPVESVTPVEVEFKKRKKAERQHEAEDGTARKRSWVEIREESDGMHFAGYAAC